MQAARISTKVPHSFLSTMVLCCIHQAVGNVVDSIISTLYQL